MKYTASDTSIEQRLSGSVLSRFWQELFRNTGQFPITLILLEFLVERMDFFIKPDLYVLIPAVLVQTYILARWQVLSVRRRLLGNLVAPALYTIGEMAFEGLDFFQSPYHILYLIFALLIGILQAAQSRKRDLWADTLLLLENVARAEILFALYVAIEMSSNPAQTVSLNEFFTDVPHQFLALAIFLLGVSAGVANVTAQHYYVLLRETAGRLNIYSEWLLGRSLLGRAMDSPDSMRLTRQQRTVLFMDIRGFTRWSEQRPPEEVASLLNEYYLTAEKLLENFRVIKYKFTADEVMAVFIEAGEAVNAARELCSQIERRLHTQRLGAGIGIHTGLLVEGLLGAKNIRFYDVIGDTVNTAQRIENSAASGEIWISEDTRAQLTHPAIKEQNEILVKGKELPVKVYSIS